MTNITGMTGMTDMTGTTGRPDRHGSLPAKFPGPARPPATTPAGRSTHLLPLFVMPRAARRAIFRSGTLTAHPWRTSARATRGQKARGHHNPYHQDGHQYQNIPHGELLLAYDCRSGRIMPAISGAFASLRPPLPDGNSVRTSWPRRGTRQATAPFPAHARATTRHTNVPPTQKAHPSE